MPLFIVIYYTLSYYLNMVSVLIAKLPAHIYI